MKKYKKVLLPLLIGSLFVLIYFAIVRINWSNLSNINTQFNLAFLALIAFIIVISVWMLFNDFEDQMLKPSVRNKLNFFGLLIILIAWVSAPIIILPYSNKLLFNQFVMSICYTYFLIKISQRLQFKYKFENGKLVELVCQDFPMEGVLAEFFGKEVFKIEKYLYAKYGIKFQKGFPKPKLGRFITDFMKLNISIGSIQKLDIGDENVLYCKIAEVNRNNKIKKIICRIDSKF